MKIASDSYSAETLARQFHEAYERMAINFGYVTRQETQAFDPESPNGQLMIAVCAEILRSGPNDAGWRKCDDSSHADRKGVHLLKSEALKGAEISVTALWQHDFYEYIVKVPPLQDALLSATRRSE